MQAEHITPQRPFPFDVVPPLTIDEEIRPKTPEEMVILGRLLKAIGVPEHAFVKLLSGMGAYRINPERLEKTVIPQQQFSGYKSGREPMPRWRLAQAVVLIEYLGCLRKKECLDILDSAESSEANKRFAHARSSMITAAIPDLNVLEQQPDIQEFLPKFRRALYLRLEADQHLSEVDQIRFQIWRDCLREIPQAQAAVGQASKKRGKKKARR